MSPPGRLSSFASPAPASHPPEGLGASHPPPALPGFSASPAPSQSDCSAAQPPPSENSSPPPSSPARRNLPPASSQAAQGSLPSSSRRVGPRSPRWRPSPHQRTDPPPPRISECSSDSHRRTSMLPWPHFSAPAPADHSSVS